MQNTARRPKITVSDDRRGIVSHAGALLLTETARVTGLQAGLSQALARWRLPRSVHHPGKIMADLAVAVALGGDCLADAAVLRAEPALSGPVASDPVISRLTGRLAGDAPAALQAIGQARAAARQRAWNLAGGQAPGAGGGLIVADIDATIVTAHSQKERAAPTWKKTYGFHRLTVFADHGPDGSGEPLAEWQSRPLDRAWFLAVVANPDTEAGHHHALSRIVVRRRAPYFRNVSVGSAAAEAMAGHSPRLGMSCWARLGLRCS